MATFGRFIGIDKFADPRISDLTGARRDATALWALFSDSLPDLQGELLVDGVATTDAMRHALDETLGEAGPEDIVILSFSGHGTHDHRLVTHDTAVSALSATAIPMAELAERFKASRAKAILCILDCCFSGGAPARVLEDSPRPRDVGVTLESLAGQGRILLAASNIDEPCYELPGTGHGLLTKAVLDVLQATTDVVSLPTAMDEILARVRAEASRIGVIQTPIMFGYIEGGMVLPPLRAGSRFYAEFPDARGARVGHNIAELGAFAIPDTVLREWQSRFPGGLNDLQLSAVNDYRVLDGASLLVVAPTSAGKTFIGELAATRAILQGRKALFLLPYRALVNEKYDQFAALYGERLGMRIVRCTGDYLDQTADVVHGKYDLALLTYEMCLNLLVSTPTLLNQVGLIVLDEAQFITDPGRGITVELLLTFLLAARERGIEPQLIALSAVIGAVNDFDAWLVCRLLSTTERPVPLLEGVLDRGGTYQYLDASGYPQATQLLPPGAIQVRRDKPSAQDTIVPLVRQLAAQGEQIIVFRNQRGSAQGCAAYLAVDLALPPARDALAQLPQHDLSTTSAALRQCLAGGTAFHNTNLTREEKAVVEKEFRKPGGQLRVLAATTTVAAGINTPASTVILAEQEFVGEDGRPFTVAEYKNMAGRAGRLGFQEEGKAIILADTPYERERLFAKYVLGRLEPIQSSFDPQQLDTWVVRLLAQVSHFPRGDVVRLLASTYGGYLANRQNPEWHGEMAQRLEALLDQMLELGLLEEEGSDIRLTLLGRACGRSALSFGSAMRLVALLHGGRREALTAETLMALMQPLRESDNGYTPMMRRGRAEAIRPREATERYGTEVVGQLQRFADDEMDYYARCKRAALLWDWVRGVPTEEIERRYSANPYVGRIGYGDIRRFADATRFALRAAHAIALATLPGVELDEATVDTLLKQLEVGLPADALGLLLLPIPLGRGEYLVLRNAGLTTADDVWSRPQEAIAELLGTSRAAALFAQRPRRQRRGEHTEV